MPSIRDRLPDLWVSAIIVVLDQLTKALIRSKLALHASVNVVPGMLDITHVRNTGAAFGMLNDMEFRYKALVMVAGAVVAVVAVGSYAVTLARTQRIARFGLDLMLGGAVGNLSD